MSALTPSENRPGPLSDASHDSVAPPTPAHEPPYYAVVFTSLRTGIAAEEYARTAARMDARVREVPGFLGSDHAATPGGTAITVAYFRDEGAITRWRDDLEHRAARERGRDEWYSHFSLHVAKVERSYDFIRGTRN